MSAQQATRVCKTCGKPVEKVNIGPTLTGGTLLRWVQVGSRRAECSANPHHYCSPYANGLQYAR